MKYQRGANRPSKDEGRKARTQTVWPECPLVVARSLPSAPRIINRDPRRTRNVRAMRIGCVRSSGVRGRSGESGVQPQPVTESHRSANHKLGHAISFHLSLLRGSWPRDGLFVSVRCVCFRVLFLTKVQKGQLIYYKTLVPLLSID